MQYQIVFFTLGLLLVINGAMMILPALLDTLGGDPNALVFAGCALFSFFIGGLMVINGRGFNQKLTIRQAYFLTTMSWVLMSVFSANPLYFADQGISYTDAVFEAVSGITTTGATVLAGLDDMPRGLLLWRAMTQWVGGIGIVAFVIILLPFLQVGGMQFYKMESSDRSDKVMARTGNLIRALVVIYCVLTLACAFAYWLFGMSGFDAWTHAMTTIPTAGYSSHDASFAYFNSDAIELAGAFFMMLGGLPFVLYVKFFYQGKFDFHKDTQVKTFIVLWLFLIAILSIHAWFNTDMSLWKSFVKSAFNLTSIITTTGFASTDYLQWGSFAVVIFLFCTYIGACTGSSSGGIKMMRLDIAFQALRAQFYKLVHPHGVVSIKFQNKRVDVQVIQGVLGFLCVYVVANTFLTIALALTGLDFETALSGAATSLANAGPGVGPIIGPAGNFSTLPDTAKWLLCLGMIAGRLELMTILVLLTPGFWRR
jgi:trk system potassium uptake protein TrkH